MDYFFISAQKCSSTHFSMRTCTVRTKSVSNYIECFKQTTTTTTKKTTATSKLHSEKKMFGGVYARL